MDDAGDGVRGLRGAATAELTEVLLRRYGIDGRRSRDLGGSSNLNLLVSDGPVGYVDHDAKMDSWDRLQAGLPMLGRIHSLLRPIQVSAEGRRPLFANHLESADARSSTARGTTRIRSWRPTPAEERLARLSEELAELVTVAEADQAEAMPRQLVHGDFWDNNVLFRDDRIVLVTDLDFMGERPRVDDLALTLYFADSTFGQEDDGSRVARLAGLVDAYDSGLDHPLTTAERAALPLAIARQPLWAIGGWLASLDDEQTARDLAAGLSADVERGLHLVREIDHWQQAFV